MTRDQEFGWRALGEYIPLIDTLLDRKISSNQQIWDKMEDRRAGLSGGVPEPSGSWQNVMVEGVPKRGEDVLRRRYVEDAIPETTGPTPRGMPFFPAIIDYPGYVQQVGQVVKPEKFNVDLKGIMDDAESAVNNSAAGQAISSTVDSINENADARSLQDAARALVDSSLEDASGFDQWLLEKFKNTDDFGRKLRANAERLNVPLGIPQGSPAERSLDKSMLTGGAGTIYDILKYLKGLKD